jgi:hypothetical protein
VPYGEYFERALVYAARLHRDQYRKGTRIPYVTHLLAVTSIVGENGGTEDEVVAALLHDGPEDQGGEAILEDIRARFGDEVAHIRRLYRHLRRSQATLARAQGEIPGPPGKRTSPRTPGLLRGQAAQRPHRAFRLQATRGGSLGAVQRR